MTDAPRLLSRSDLERTAETISTIATSTGAPRAAAVAAGLIDGLVFVVQLLQEAGRLKLVEATATESHEMTVRE